MHQPDIKRHTFFGENRPKHGGHCVCYCFCKHLKKQNVLRVWRELLLGCKASLLGDVGTFTFTLYVYTLHDVGTFTFTRLVRNVGLSQGLHIKPDKRVGMEVRGDEYWEFRVDSSQWLSISTHLEYTSTVEAFPKWTGWMLMAHVDRLCKVEMVAQLIGIIWHIETMQPLRRWQWAEGRI